MGQIATWVVVAFVLIGVIAAAAGGGNKHNANLSTSNQPSVTVQSPDATGSSESATTVQGVAPTSPPTVATTSPPQTAPPTTAPPPPPNGDKGWTVVTNSLLTKNDGAGNFGGTVRLTNTNSDFETGTFTFTLFRGSSQTATLEGSADGVTPGQTVTVRLTSQDPYSAGTYTFTFQTDTTFPSDENFPQSTSTTDKGWSVVSGSLLTQDDGAGNFGGTVRLTNTNSMAQTGTFTFTLFRGSSQIAVLEGSADGASPNQTVTVQLASEDPYSAGSYTWYFQTDTSFSS